MLSCPLAKFKGHSFASQPASQQASSFVHSPPPVSASPSADLTHQLCQVFATATDERRPSTLTIMSNGSTPIPRFPLSFGSFHFVCAQAICAMDILGTALRGFDKRCQLQNVLKDCAQCTDFCGCLPPACGAAQFEQTLDSLFIFAGLRTCVETQTEKEWRRLLQMSCRIRENLKRVWQIHE